MVRDGCLFGEEGYRGVLGGASVMRRSHGGRSQPPVSLAMGKGIGRESGGSCGEVKSALSGGQ